MRTITLDTAPTLDALLALILQLDAERERDDDRQLEDVVDLHTLPTYGGEAPRDTGLIWSWDETRLLTCGAHGWRIESRPKRGRPPGRSPNARTEKVDIYLTAAEVADMDGRRGDVGRSEWLARAAGLRLQ